MLTDKQVDEALEPILRSYWRRHRDIDCTDLKVMKAGVNPFRDLDHEFHLKCEDAGIFIPDRLRHARRAYDRGCARFGTPAEMKAAWERDQARKVLEKEAMERERQRTTWAGVTP